MATDQVKGRSPSPERGSRTFSKAEFFADGTAAVEYAAATGVAVVVDAEGNPITVISIPTADLPVLDG